MSGEQATGSLRLFLALWPGAVTRARLQAHGNAWAWPPSAATVGPGELHLTLHFLGAVPGGRLPGLLAGLQVPCRPFELHFGVSGIWRKGVAVVEPRAVPAALLELHGALGGRLREHGLPVEARPFRPHVTLARRAEQAVPPAGAAAFRWPVRGYALVQSPGDRYVLLRRYACGRPGARAPA